MTKPNLSIIIPMREGVCEDWLTELSKITGSVEFILVYPPNVKLFTTVDSRIKQIISPLRGEVIQRITALLNASGMYVLSINCDEYLYPDIEAIAQEYFNLFPNSYFLRLRTKLYPYGSATQLLEEWQKIPSLQNFKVKTKIDRDMPPSDSLQEICISPLENKFDFFCIFRPFPGRKDHHGSHQENFDKKIWKNSLVQQNLIEIVEKFTIFGVFKYVPFWCSDRLLGLSTQAKLYQQELAKKDSIIAHWLPENFAQIRTEDNPPEYRGKNRRYVLAEVLLLILYPQYGYFWNLVLSQWRSIFR